MGRISIYSGNLDKAIAAYERAISLNPNYALAHFGLAHGLWHAGRPAEALPHYDVAIRLSPHDPILWAILASKSIALVMDERYEEGIALSEEAQRHNDSQLFCYLAEVSGLGILGRENEAAEALGRLRKVQPEISIAFLERSLAMSESVARDRYMQGLSLAGLT